MQPNTSHPHNANMDAGHENVRTSISSITKGPRQSNIELLRILAMFLVLVLHADFGSLGIPSHNDVEVAPGSSVCRILFGALGTIAVNVFVLISGWFTIKPTLKGVCAFIFQCLFISIGVYFVAFLSGNLHVGITSVVRDGVLFEFGGYWFIKSYLVLYAFSPVLNTFVQYASKRTMMLTLLCFYILQTVCSTTGFMDSYIYSEGYTPLSFFGLYILAQLIRRYYNDFDIRTALLLFCGALLFNTLVPSANILWGLHLPIAFYYYSSPLVIVEAVALLMIFVRIKIKPNKYINWISSSAFAVYLFHSHPLLFDKFKDEVRYIFQSDSVFTLLAIFTFLFVVYAASILIDQPRKIIWKYISKMIFSKSSVPLN